MKLSQDRRLFRTAAVGLTGILAASNAALPASAFSVTGAQTNAGDPKAEKEEEAWERSVLERLDIDPDELPPREEEVLPEVPEDLVPYFREWTSYAVDTYGDDLPPETDLGMYSPRADALRAKIREIAEHNAQEMEKCLEQMLENLARNAGRETLSAWSAALLERSPAESPASAVSPAFAESAETGDRPTPADRSLSTEDPASAEGPASAERDSSAAEPAVSQPKIPFLSKEEGGSEKAARNISSVARFLGESAPNLSLEEDSSDRTDGTAVESAGSGEAGRDPSGGSRSAEASLTEDPSSDTRFPERRTDEAAEEFEGSAYALLTQRYGPLQRILLPVPPELYDFRIRFPADVRRMETRHGRTLVPGLANCIPTVYDIGPEAAQADAGTGKEEERADGSASAAAESADAGLPAEEGPAYDMFDAEDPLDEEPVNLVRKYDHEEDTLAEPARRLVLIGDSRTVGLRMYVDPVLEAYWSAENSMGYNWMVSKGVPAVEDVIGENTDVAILMGVNDLGNVGRYADYINEKAREWNERGARVFFVSVTPVDDRRSPNAKNSRIESFNDFMTENLEGVHYIDAYSRIRNSFGSPDGIHYDSATYREIYRIIRFYVYRGWYEENGLWFYFDCGKPRTGWQYLNGRWQYFDGNGVRWITDGRVGDVCLAPYPDTELLDPYEGIRHGTDSMQNR